MKKLNLNDLQVTSFVTGQKVANVNTIKGGTETYSADQIICDTITIFFGTCDPRRFCAVIP